jgi:hypothetical protein
VSQLYDGLLFMGPIVLALVVSSAVRLIRFCSTKPVWFKNNAVDLRVWRWGCGMDDLQRFAGTADGLRRAGAFWASGQELRHLAFGVSDHGAQAAGRVDLLFEFTGEVGGSVAEVVRGEKSQVSR